jgi:alcohol dehydrogenase class IV
MRSFEYTTLPGHVIFGRGVARERLGEAVDRVGGRRLIVITTTSERALADALAAPLADRVVATFTDVRPHVPVPVAEAARTAASAAGADAILSIGGGSTTGTAKAVALGLGLPIVAVPTTYAGSEVTPVWGMTEGARKQTGRDPRVLPRVVVYDPELTVSLPASLTAVSGLNALAHSVEAFWAPGANPVTSVLAEEAIRALSIGLPQVVADPGDVDGRGDVLYGAWLAGSAFAVAGSALHHKICHVLGGAYDLPHAEMHAVVLPHATAFLSPAVPEADHRIAAALGSRPETTSAATALLRLARELDAPTALQDIGLRHEELDHAAELVAEQAPAQPRPLDRAHARALLEAAWGGTEPTTLADPR